MLRLATGGIYSDDFRFPQNGGIVGICYHETALFGQNFDRKSVGNCKIHLISERQIVSPLIIGAEIGDGGFDLNNNLKTLAVQTHHIHATVRGQFKFRKRAIPE